jgi:hypothetical protein
MGFDTFLAQSGLMELAMVIGACRAHVPGPQTPTCGGEDRSGDLAAESDFAGYDVGFAVASSESFYAENHISCVLSNTCEIGDGNGHVGQGYPKSRKIQKGKSISV